MDRHSDHRILGTPRPLSRRDLLSGGATLAAVSLSSVSLSGCQFLSTDPGGKDANGEAGKKVAKGKEAPALAALVKDGKLPALADRMPKVPRVIDPIDRIGVYGGDWNTAVLGPSDTAWLYRTIGYEHLMNWDVGWRKPIPNIAESVEVDAEATTFTFHLRQGLKWSDGELFTADNIVFACDDFYFDKDVNPQAPTWLIVAGKPGKVEKVDDLTVRFTFAATNGLFLENIAQPAGESLTNRPRHYLEQFHKKYNPEVEKLARSRTFPSGRSSSSRCPVRTNTWVCRGSHRGWSKARWAREPAWSPNATRTTGRPTPTDPSSRISIASSTRSSPKRRRWSSR